MIQNDPIEFEYYTALGQLFYAIAACDSKVRNEEVAAFQKSLQTYEFSSSQETNQIVSEFIRLVKLDAPPQKCYYFFQSFKRKHPQLFSENIKSRIMKTAISIASTVSQFNKSELVMMSQLDFLLKE